MGMEVRARGSIGRSRRTHAVISTPLFPQSPNPTTALPHRVRNWVDLTMAFFCVLFAACASGLTIGLMSMDELELEIKERVGTEEEVRAWWAVFVYVLLLLFTHICKCT